MKLTLVKLGTVCRDKTTDLEGTITHWIMDMSQQVNYLFQPRGLDDEGQPVKKLYLDEARLEVTDDSYEEVDIPFEILGTQVRAKASGFTGMAIEFIYHINGCSHIFIQPAGLCEKTKKPFAKNDFDIRECEGEVIAQLSEPELAQSKREKPSPSGDDFDRQMPSTS